MDGIRVSLIFRKILISPYSPPLPHPRRGVSRLSPLHGPSRVRGGEGVAPEGIHARRRQGQGLGDGRGEDAEEGKAHRQPAGRSSGTEEGGPVDLREGGTMRDAVLRWGGRVCDVTAVGKG